MENILISACLIGVNCKYDGGNNKISEKELSFLKDIFNLIPFCPEQLGGLATPRVPCEVNKDKVINKNNDDLTKEFYAGAKESLKLAKFYNPKYIILKSKSPSCGIGKIYDGSFTKNLIAGDGITARALKKAGFNLISEKENLLCLKR